MAANEATAMDRLRARTRLLRSANEREWLAFVSVQGEPEVRVRFRRSTGPMQWRCDACGGHRFSTCPHERAAARRIRQENNG